MFGWLRRTPPPAYDDRVWIDDAARLDALVQAARGGPVVVVAFFEDTRRRIASRLDADGIAFASGRAATDRPAIVAADRIGSAYVGATATVHVAEHHPFAETDRALLDALVAAGVRPVFHTALDEPLIRRFGGDRIAAMMGQLGMERSEPVEHPLVRKSLADMREKVAAKVKFPRDAPSMDEWVRLNLEG
jgi:hypothetical protein